MEKFKKIKRGDLREMLTKNKFDSRPLQLFIDQGKWSITLTFLLDWKESERNLNFTRKDNL